MISPIVVVGLTARVPDVGNVTDVAPVTVIVVANAPENVKLPPRESEPVPNVSDEPEPAVVNKVPEVGNVTFVAPVVVNVRALAPDVVKFAARSRLPASFKVLAALTISIVNVRPAVRAVEDVAAIVTSNAAEVSRTPNPVNAVCVPPEIDGLVANTTLPDPVEDVQDGAAELVPSPVCPRNALVVEVFPASLVRVPGVPVADA